MRLTVTVRSSIFLLLAGLGATTFAVALLSLWYASHTQALYTSTMDKAIHGIEAAYGLENALVMQKGYATYYFLNSDPKWLEELERRRTDFEKWLKKARDAFPSEDGRKLINELDSEYIHYDFSRKQILALYKDGLKDQGAAQHWAARDRFQRLVDVCRKYRSLQEQGLVEILQNYQRRATLVSVFGWASIPFAALLAFLLGYILLKRVLQPIRRLAIGIGAETAASIADDEVMVLDQKMRSLMQDVDQAQLKLDESREHLIQTEKLALVGKMAAGVAHSIRNPLTSVKMRLFTLERTLELQDTQKDDFEVIAEEIRHIDAILRNFLEFSRPPKLKMQRLCPSDVVDNTLQLLRHRLESHRIEVEVNRERPLPEVQGDPDQLKEVLMNLLINACEAMPDGGEVVILEEAGVMEPWGRVAILRVSDNGPGIPASIQKKVLEPFFSTKEDGTGLGLSIAQRIISEHGGWIHIQSGEGKGATIVLGLPCVEKSAWLRS